MANYTLAIRIGFATLTFSNTSLANSIKYTKAYDRNIREANI